MPALSMVLARGDADLTDLPCSRSTSPDWLPALRRRRPSAARSLLRNPPARASLTCGASSGRRLMAPASLPNYYEAARGTSERWSSAPASAGLHRCQPVRGPSRRPTATPTTDCRKPRQRRSPTGCRPCSSPRSRCNLQHRPDGTPVDVRSRLALGGAPLLAERCSRRHTRSPGEAGGGRSDLCHDNDEPDPVNRRGRVGDNVDDPAAELTGGTSSLLKLHGTRLPPRDQEPPSQPQ